VLIQKWLAAAGKDGNRSGWQRSRNAQGKEVEGIKQEG